MNTKRRGIFTVDFTCNETGYELSVLKSRHSMPSMPSAWHAKRCTHNSRGDALASTVRVMLVNNRFNSRGVASTTTAGQ